MQYDNYSAEGGDDDSDNNGSDDDNNNDDSEQDTRTFDTMSCLWSQPSGTSPVCQVA